MEGQQNYLKRETCSLLNKTISLQNAITMTLYIGKIAFCQAIKANNSMVQDI